MTALELIIDCLNFYGIEIANTTHNRITLSRDYEIEVEANGLYKLKSNGQVVAPFDDVDDLCRFIQL